MKIYVVTATAWDFYGRRIAAVFSTAELARAYNMLRLHGRGTVEEYEMDKEVPETIENVKQMYKDLNL